VGKNIEMVSLVYNRLAKGILGGERMIQDNEFKVEIEAPWGDADVTKPSDFLKSRRWEVKEDEPR